MGACLVIWPVDPVRSQSRSIPGTSYSRTNGPEEKQTTPRRAGDPRDVGMAGAATFPSPRGRASPSVKSVDAILLGELLVEVHSPGELVARPRSGDGPAARTRSGDGLAARP